MADGFNPVEAKLLICMLRNLNGPPTIPVNWEACAQDAGYKNAASARSQWLKLKARRGIGEGNTSAAIGKRKTDDTADGEREDTGIEGGTPKKKAVKKGNTVKVPKQAEDDGKDGQDAEPESAVKAENEEDC